MLRYKLSSGCEVITWGERKILYSVSSGCYLIVSDLLFSRIVACQINELPRPLIPKLVEFDMLMSLYEKEQATHKLAESEIAKIKNDIIAIECSYGNS